MYTHAVPHWIEILLLIAGLSFVVWAGTYKLTDSPAIWYDEGFYTQLAMNLAEGRGQVLQVAPDVYVSSAGVTAGYPFIGPIALSYKLFGTSVLQGRAMMVIFMVLFAGAIYAFVRALFGARHAILALILVATYPVLYGNGKSVLGEVPGLLFLMLTLLALVWLERSNWRSLPAYALVGLAAGLCVATKPIFILLGPAGVIAVLLASRWRMLLWRGVALTIATFTVPMVAWFLMQFGPGDSLASIVSFYANPYEYSVGGIVHLMAANAVRFFKELSPLYTLFFTAIWTATLFFRMREGRRVSVAEWTAFLFSMLVLIFFLRTPGWYRYFFPATMIALLFAPRSLELLYEQAGRRASFLKRAPLPVVFVCALALLQMYQLGWNSWVASYYGSTRTEIVQEYLSSLPNSAGIFLYNVPELAVLLPSRNYYQYLMPHPGQIIGGEHISALTEGKADFVIVNSETYRMDPTLFAKYQIRGTVSRYTVLERL